MGDNPFFKQDPGALSADERRQLEAEMGRFGAADRRRQVRAVVAVLASVAVAAALIVPLLLLTLSMSHSELKLIVLSTAPGIGAGAFVWRKLYPKDFWGRQ